MKRFLPLVLVVLATDAFAGLPLTNYQTLPASARSQIGPVSNFYKGTSDNYWYAPELDPTTGTWNTIQPVSGSITATNPSVSTTGAAVPGSATYAGMNVAGNLTGLAGTASGLKVDVQALPATAATAAKQDTGNTSVGSIDTKTPALGNTTMAGSVPVTMASNQTAFSVNATLAAGAALVGKVGIDQTTPGTTNGVQVNAALPAGTALIGKVGIDQTTPGTTNGVQINAALPAGTALIGKTGIDQTTPGTTNAVSATNFPSTVDTNVGLAGASTPRYIAGGRAITSNVVASNNYASTSVTTAAYVQLIASTANAVNRVCPSNSSGSIIIMATGGAGAEVDRIYLPAGGAGCFENNIAASTRISMKALDATASVGWFLFNGLP